MSNVNNMKLQDHVKIGMENERSTPIIIYTSVNAEVLEA